jgi:tetratricopeptide (TPR) repeat protein
MILQAAGAMDAAGQTYEDALRRREKLFGPNDPSTAMSRFRLAEWQAATGDLANAVQNHEAVLAVRRDCLHAEHPDMERSLLAVGRLYVQLDRPADAEPLLRECHDLRQQRLPAGHYRIVEVDVALGTCLLRQGQTGAAEQLLTRALAAVPAEAGATDPVRRDALVGLIEICEESGRITEAGRYQAELDAAD